MGSASAGCIADPTPGGHLGSFLRFLWERGLGASAACSPPPPRGGHPFRKGGPSLETSSGRAGLTKEALQAGSPHAGGPPPSFSQAGLARARGMYATALGNHGLF